MSNIQTLESVRHEIEHWRRTKTGRGRIPNRIWTNAVALLGRHTMSEICRVLRLSHNQFKTKQKHKDPFTLHSDTPFYEIAMPSIKHQQTDIHLGAAIELKKPDGTLITIKHLSDPVLMNLITALIRSA